MGKGTNLQKWGTYTEDAATEEQEVLAKEGSGTDYLKLEPGKNVVRIMPPAAGRTSPFQIVYQHYIELPDGKKWSFTCPRLMAKKRCPACQMSDQLRKTGNPADAEQARSLQAKRRVFANAIDRKDEDAGPKVLAFGKTIHEALVKLRRDEDVGGDYTHPTDGFDVVIDREGTGQFDTKYSVNMARKSRPLTEDPDEMEAWRVGMHDLNRFALVPTEEEIMARLRGEDPPARKQLTSGTQQRRTSGKQSGKSASRARPQRMAQDEAFDADYEIVDDDEFEDEDDV